MIEILPAHGYRRCASCGNTTKMCELVAGRSPWRTQTMWLCRGCIETELLSAVLTFHEEEEEER